jgi:hypothetical protein
MTHTDLSGFPEDENRAKEDRTGLDATLPPPTESAGGEVVVATSA